MSDDAKNNAKPSWRKWLLIGSLGVNMIVVGALVGFAFQSKDTEVRGKRGGPGALGSLGMLARALPEEERKALRQDFSSTRESFHAARGRVDAANQAIFDVIEADIFDRDALKGAFEARDQVMGSISRNAHELFAARLEKMSVQERKTFVARVKEIRKNHGKRRKGGRRP